MLADLRLAFRAFRALGGALAVTVRVARRPHVGAAAVVTCRSRRTSGTTIKSHQERFNE
jgi:hypothetical protein